MNCPEAREQMELRLDEALESTAARRLDEHLNECVACQAAYQLIKTEKDLLEQAMQADVSSAAEIDRIEAGVRERTLPAPPLLSAAWEAIMPFVGVPVVGTLLGFLVLAFGRFDGAAVREAISRSLSPAGGLPVAILTALAVVSLVLGVLIIQPWVLGFESRNSQEENSHV